MNYWNNIQSYFYKFNKELTPITLELPPGYWIKINKTSGKRSLV